MSKDQRAVMMEASEELSVSQLMHVIAELEERLEDRKHDELEDYFS